MIDRKKEPQVPQVPVINIPRGDYSSYRIKAGPDGYEVEYRANDPKILESERSLDLNKEKRGMFGGGSEERTEYRRDQYTMDGTRNIGGSVSDAEGKSNAQSAECIAADAGARAQGAMAGSAIAAGVIVPVLSNSPIHWMVSRWLGIAVGSACWF